MRILASITNNVNVIKYFEAFMDQNYDPSPFGNDSITTPCLCIIMEYADNGDLF